MVVGDGPPTAVPRGLESTEDRSSKIVRVIAAHARLCSGVNAEGRVHPGVAAGWLEPSAPPSPDPIDETTCCNQVPRAPRRTCSPHSCCRAMDSGTFEWVPVVQGVGAAPASSTLDRVCPAARTVNTEFCGTACIPDTPPPSRSPLAPPHTHFPPLRRHLSSSQIDADRALISKLFDTNGFVLGHLGVEAWAGGLAVHAADTSLSLTHTLTGARLSQCAAPRSALFGLYPCRSCPGGCVMGLHTWVCAR